MRRFALADPGSWEATSPASDDYNCAAWVVGVTDANWWPHPELDEYYWPEGVVRDGSLESFVAGYGTLGYEVSPTGELEEGYEKLVIYATRLQSPLHVARQLPDGRWTSKLGPWEDIIHESPQTLAGSHYGNPVVFLQRRREAATAFHADESPDGPH
ncbi:MAG: DUF7689 domain-containing protein [Tepidiformaceae bacterium]